MRIVDSLPTPGSTLYSVVCWCGRPFNTTGDNRGKAKCPKCHRENDIRAMVTAWTATPAEKLARLKGISAEARALRDRWLALPELKRSEGDGKAMADKLDEFYAEAKWIVAEIEQGGQTVGAAEGQKDS